MRTSEDGKRMIKSFETLRLVAFMDYVGVPTIGWGHKKGVYLGMQITSQEAETLLDRDLKEAEKNLAPYHQHYIFSQHEYDALISFIYSGGDIESLTKEMTIRKHRIADALKESAIYEPDSMKRNRRALERYIFLLSESEV